ncbi:hypothetical protein LINPERHAP1_LOCUS8235 [Linum perenne]
MAMPIPRFPELCTLYRTQVPVLPVTKSLALSSNQVEKAPRGDGRIEFREPCTRTPLASLPFQHSSPAGSQC